MGVHGAWLVDDPAGYGNGFPVHLDGFRYERLQRERWRDEVSQRFECWLPDDPESSRGAPVDSAPARAAYRPQPR